MSKEVFQQPLSYTHDCLFKSQQKLSKNNLGIHSKTKSPGNLKNNLQSKKLHYKS